MSLLKTAVTSGIFLASAVLTLSVIPAAEPAGYPPEGFEDRLVMWPAQENPEAWFVGQPTNCVCVDIWGGLCSALFSDGTVLVWGPRYDSRYDPPENVTNAVAVDLGEGHILALHPDGAVTAWGDNTYGQTNVPDHVTNAVAVAAGACHSLALLSDGTVAAWGDNSSGGQTNVPGSVTNATAIAAGAWHSLALLADGKIAAWGSDSEGQCGGMPQDATNAVAVAAGFTHSLALLADGTVRAWGANRNYQCDIPPSLSGKAVSAIGATWADTSWAIAEDGGLHLWGDSVTPPVPHAQSPLFMRFLSYAGEPGHTAGGTNIALVRIPAGGASLADADGDGLSGSDELLLHNTDPHSGDTDGDGLKDGWELSNGLDPLDPADALLDPDGDGIPTADEVNVFGTDPFNPDSDGDTLTDGAETAKCYALFIDGAPGAYSLTWVEPSPGAGAAPAVAVGATKWTRNVVFENGTAIQQRRYSRKTYEGVAGVACGTYQSLFIDPGGGALGVIAIDTSEPYLYYEGAFGSFPLEAAAGFCHAIALREDGSVTNIGAFADAAGDVYTDDTPPGSLTLTTIVPGTNTDEFISFTTPAATTNPPPVSVQAAAGTDTAIALGQDGKVMMWGRPYRNVLDVPPDLSNVVKVAGGVYHSVALLADGTVRAWGRNLYNQLNVPAGLSNVVDIACTDLSTVALREDSTVAAWGFWYDTVVTWAPAYATGCASVSAVGDGAWGLTADGQIFGWGEESMPVSLLPWKAVSAAFANNVSSARCGVALVRLDTDPLAADSDGDGLSDGLEYALAFNPRDPADGTDADANGLPDAWENLHFGAAGQDPHADPDGDGVPNHAECRLGGDPLFSVRAASASRGWHGLAWNAFPGAASYSVAVVSGGQAVTTLVTGATSAVLTGRLPWPACSATVTARSADMQTLRTASESWTQPAAGSGVTAWKLAPAFTVHRPSGYAFTNLLDLTLTVNRTAQWEDLFVSSAPSAAGWSLSGATLAWHDGGAGGTASASPADSLHLAAATAGTETITLRLNMPTGEGVTRSSTPLYLLRWAPELGFEIPEDAGSQAYVIATERRAVLAENGSAVPLPAITVADGGYPHLSSGPAYPRNLPFSADAAASVTNEAIAVTGPGALSPAAASPGTAGAGTLSFGSAAVPPPAQPAFQLTGLGQPTLPGDPPRDLPLDVTCVSHTVTHIWNLIGSSCDCAYPSGLFCSYDNLCSCGYTSDIDDRRSTHFILRVNAASGEIQSDPAANVPTAFNGADPHPVSISWANGPIFTGLVFPKPPDFDSRCSQACTNAVDSCGGGGSPCGCEEGGCGDEGPALGSARFLLKLGASGARASEGALYFDTPTPAVSRANLRLFGDGTAVSITNAGGIASVTTALGRAVTAADTADGFTLTVASPLPGEGRVWEITNPGGDTSAARFVKNPGLASEQAFLLRAPDGNGWWRLETLGPGGAVRSVLAKRPPAGTDDTAEELTLEPGGGDPGSPLAGFRRLAHTRTVYTSVNGFRRAARVETWNGAAGAFETLSHTYAPATGDAVLNTKPWLTVRPDGSWEHLAYDAIGRVVRRAAPAAPGIEPPSGDPVLFDPSAVPGLRVTAYTYPPDYTNALLPGLARTAAESLVTAEGALPLAFTWTDAAAVTNTVGGEAVPCLSNAVTRARAPGALKGDPANARSAEIACGGRREDWRRGLPVYRLSEDGLETRWRYEEGTCAGGAFTPGAGGPHIRAVSVTLPASGATVPGNAAVADIAVTDALWGHTLLAETRLPPGGDISGDPAAWPLLAWSRHAYDGTRPSLTLHSDGTSESNVWDCCRLTSATARDGTVTGYDAFPAEGLAYAREVSLAALPGADGRYPVAETFSDGLGRATNSLRTVWFNGARDAAYTPLATLTAYPYGTDHLSVMTDPLGVETVTRTWQADGADVTETVTPGVTNRVTRYSGGATVEEEFKTDPVSGEALSRAVRTETAWGTDGRETVTVSVSRNGGPWTTDSVTRKDFLGRAAVTERAGHGGSMLVTSNAYDAAGRLAFTRNLDGSATAHAYDALGNGAGTVLIGAGQTLDFDPQDFTLEGVAALGKYVIEETPAWKEESDLGLSAHGVPTAWWECSASVSRLPGQDAVTTSVTRVQLTGLSAACVSRTVTTGADGVSAIAAEALDAANARKTVTLRNTAAAGHEASVTVAGRVTGGTNALGAAVAYLYDGFARRTSAEETAGGRTLRTLTGYHADGGTAFTDEILGAATNRTRYSQRQYLDPPAGAYLVTVTDALGNVATNFHSGDGALYRSGGAVYPTATARDADGRQAELRTWRDEAGQPDATRWHYDLASGLVTNKVYADGLGPAYAYLPDGRLSQRTWARGVETAYGYADTAAGRVQSADHSDGTPSVTNAYDLAGRLTRVEDGAGARTFAYDALGRLAAETNALAVITRVYDAQGRDAGCDLDIPGYATVTFSVRYGYDGHGRLDHVVSALAGVTNSFRYSFLPETPLVAGMTNAAGFGRSQAYEPNRNLTAAVSNRWNDSLVSDFDYANDALGRRTLRVDTAQGLPVTNVFAYNPRSEVTDAAMGASTYSYSYDDIGNRVWSAENALTNTYAANSLNQYTNILCVPAPLRLDYDADGNMLTNGVWSYAWDAENRMTGAASNGVPAVSNAYDHRHRRIRKDTTAGTWLFAYDGWNLTAEVFVDSQTGATNVTRYLWGPDLSGTLQGAGGVGGLLAVIRPDGTFFPCYDANGNVTDYVDAYGNVRVHFEYDAFGNTIAMWGDLAHTFRFRFSTKYWDEETCSYYYGYRHYAPKLGCWLNRDPIEELSGINIYSFAWNDGMNHFDMLGQFNMPNSWLVRYMDMVNQAQYSKIWVLLLAEVRGRFAKGGDPWLPSFLALYFFGDGSKTVILTKDDVSQIKETNHTLWFYSEEFKSHPEKKAAFMGHRIINETESNRRFEVITIGGGTGNDTLGHFDVSYKGEVNNCTFKGHYKIKDDFSFHWDWNGGRSLHGEAFVEFFSLFFHGVKFNIESEWIPKIEKWGKN